LVTTLEENISTLPLVEDQPYERNIDERSPLPFESQSFNEDFKEESLNEGYNFNDDQVYEDYMDKGEFVEESLEQPCKEDLDKNLECENDQKKKILST